MQGHVSASSLPRALDVPSEANTPSYIGRDTMNLLRIFPALLISLPLLYAQRATAPLVIHPTAKGEVPAAKSAFVMNAMCDDAGNVYSRPVDQEAGWGGIRKVAGDASSAQIFAIQGKTFFVRGRQLYSLMKTSSGAYVIELNSDGTEKARTKLAVDPAVDILHLAVFKSGGYLVVGLIGTATTNGPHLRTPYTAVFASDGRLVKMVYEPEDEDARLHAESNDSKYFRCCSDSGNEFVMYNADVGSGSDDNAYLLHGGFPQLVYVISSAGNVVRKFPVSNQDPNLVANSIKYYSGKLAIGFGWMNEVPETLVSVTDTNGRLISEYKVVEKSGDSNPILACYDSNRLTLLPRWVGSKPYILTAKLP